MQCEVSIGSYLQLIRVLQSRQLLLLLLLRAAQCWQDSPSWAQQCCLIGCI